MVYCFGNLIVSITSLPPLGAGEIPGPMIGLFLIALGTGGIKPCVSAFGGDQFTSDQTHLLQSFFSVFYFAINAGSLLSMLITPVLRGNVKLYINIVTYIYLVILKEQFLTFYVMSGVAIMYPPFRAVCVTMDSCLATFIRVLTSSYEVKSLI